MTEKKQRLSVKEAVAYNRRAFGIWWKLDRQLYIATALNSAANALTPYVPLYFTARLVNELAGARDPARLWQWLAVLLVSTAAAALLRAYAARRALALLEASYASWNGLLAKKLLEMDYCDVDDPATQGLLDQIKQNSNWAGWGLNRMINDSEQFMTALRPRDKLHPAGAGGQPSSLAEQPRVSGGDAGPAGVHGGDVAPARHQGKFLLGQI